MQTIEYALVHLGNGPHVKFSGHGHKANIIVKPWISGWRMAIYIYILTIGEQLYGTAYNQALGMLIVLRPLKQATVDQC